MIGRRLAFLAVLASAFASAEVAAEPVSVSCLYNGRLYSDGALICVQKALMLSCSTDGVRAEWKAVTDQGMESRCLGPNTSAYTPAPRHTRHIYAAQYRVSMPMGTSAKCFYFAGKRSCE